MKHTFNNSKDTGQINLVLEEQSFEQNYYLQQADFNFHSIAWNRGPAQVINIDEVQYLFAENSILPIMLNQSFSFENMEHIVLWQFNREFYCIANHDAEVGCVGFIFFGPSPTMFVSLDEEDIKMMNSLLMLFEEEFTSKEDIKGEMLRMLLVRLIIKITRLAKKQYLGTEDVVEDKFNLIRKFHLLVEIHFKKERQVNFYAGLLNKSPKTVSNYFAMYSKKTPVQIIHERIITEAKRLVYYTDKSIKEIAEDLGFEDVAHFSKFFKNVTTKSPSELRSSQQGRN